MINKVKKNQGRKRALIELKRYKKKGRRETNTHSRRNLKQDKKRSNH